MSCGSKIDLDKLITGGDFRDTIERLHQDIREGKYTREAIIAALLAYIIYLKTRPTPEPDTGIVDELKADSDAQAADYGNLAGEGREMRRSFENQIADLKQKNSVLTNELKACTEKNTALERDLAGKQNSISECERKLAEEKKKTEMLAAQYATTSMNLVSETKEWKQKFDEAILKNSNLEHKNETLERNKADLEQKLAEAKQDNGRLNQEKSQLQSDLLNRNGENYQLKQELEKKNADAKSAVQPGPRLIAQNDYDISNHEKYIELKNELRESEDRLIEAMKHVEEYKTSAETAERKVSDLIDFKNVATRQQSQIAYLERTIGEVEDKLLKQIQNCRDEKELQRKRIESEYMSQLDSAANQLAEVKSKMAKMRSRPLTQTTVELDPAILERKQELENEQSQLEATMKQLNSRKLELEKKIRNLNLEYETDGKAHRMLQDMIANSGMKTEEENRKTLSDFDNFILETYITKKQYFPIGGEYDAFNFGVNIQIIVYLIVLLVILMILYNFSVVRSGHVGNQPESVRLKQG